MTAIAVIQSVIIPVMRADIRVLFAQRLKQLRTKAGYSIPELAKKSRISRQHVRDLELPFPQKRVTITTLQKLADGFKIPVWKLLQFKGPSISR